MNEQTIKALARYIAAAEQLKASGAIDELVADVEDLVARVKATVGTTKADGTPFTDADLDAEVANAHEHFNAAIARS